ncbi:hypothetical protein D3C71_1726650 [compost metagenome]
MNRECQAVAGGNRVGDNRSVDAGDDEIDRESGVVLYSNGCVDSTCEILVVGFANAGCEIEELLRQKNSHFERPPLLFDSTWYA